MKTGYEYEILVRNCHVFIAAQIMWSIYCGEIYMYNENYFDFAYVNIMVWDILFIVKQYLILLLAPNLG